MAGFGAVGAIGGAIAQPIAAHFAQKRAFKYTKKMMKNKWQWEVADLIAAGLNPILGYTKGGPSIGPSGIPSIAGGMGATAIGAAKLREELRILRATADRTEAEVPKTAAQTKKLELEVTEFPPTIGGVGRRILEGVDVKKAGEGLLKFIGEAPKWIRDRFKAAADR